MKNSRKAIILLGISISIAIVISIYSFSAHNVASHVYEYDGILKWATPGYTFLPWPKTPTGIVAQVLVPMSQPDIQYYRYVIQSGLLVALTILSWIAVFCQAYKLRKLYSKLRNTPK